MADNTIRLHDKTFILYKHSDEILSRVRELARELKELLPDETIPVFVPILKGAFVFAADFVRFFKGPCEIDFIKASSYTKDKSSGELTVHVSLDDVKWKGRTIVLLDGIVDTGLTLNKLVADINKFAGKVFVVTLFDKHKERKHNVQLDLVGFKIPSLFIVGYGMDYRGLGRNLPHVYIHKESL
ncbi:MAG: hypoxanthine phosphoribosyltransferase [Chlorobi bacterium]|nr:hypoxanthine phosphoribosyltransferase [Chlorobiota bacterium]